MWDLEGLCLIIRQEKPSDFVSIYDLVKAAFSTAKVANGDEQDFVNRLRVSSNYVPELAFVAEEDEKIVGHIMLTRTLISATEGNFEVLLLAPLCVAFECRNRGIGSQLVKYSFESAKDLGFKAVFVVGDPSYYHRFGFKSSTFYGIHNVPEIPSDFVMVYELYDGSLKGIHGTVTLS